MMRPIMREFFRSLCNFAKNTPHQLAESGISLCLLLLTLGCSGCAVAPEFIPPSYVSPFTYQNWSCEQLAEESHRLVSAYATAAARQQQAHTGDAVGVLLLGLPVSSMSGQNIAPEIGRLKGEHEALARVAIHKGCPMEAPTETA